MSSSQEVAQSRLFRLPAELRVHIYGLVLIAETPQPINWSWIAPSLLRTCRQLRNEASPVYYANNSFLGPDLRDSPQLYLWLVAIGPRQYGRIRRICLTRSYYIDEGRARMAIRACRYSLANAGIEIPLAVFHVQSFVNGQPPAIWINIPSLPQLQVDTVPDAQSGLPR